MRIRDIIRTFGELRYKVRHDGPNRKERKELANNAKFPGGPAKTKPKNWTRDKSKRRKKQKRRRKQSWKA